MLKWIKKIKNWLQSEEIIEIEEVIIEDDTNDYEEIQKSIQNKQTRPIPQNVQMSHQRNTHLNDPDAKVLYQYPKGQFKFPLVPDERPLPKRRSNVRIREDKQPLVQDKQHQSSPVVNTKPAVPEPKPKIGSPKKPFRPTEIPSPVYGFQRPQKQKAEKTVEFELETQLESKTPLDVPALFRKSNQSGDQPILESIQQQVINEEKIPIVKEEEVSEILAVEKEEDVPEILAVEKEEDVPEILPVVNIEEKQSVWSDLVVEDNKKSDQPVIVEEKMEYVQLVAVNEESPSMLGEEATNEMEDKQVAETKEEQPRKKHIPFNVVMLKQDHKKQNFPSFREMEKKTELFHRVPDSEKITEIPTDEKKSVYQESESVLHKEATDEPKQEACTVEALVEEKAEELDSVQTQNEEVQENPYYVFPEIELLAPPTTTENDEEWLEEQTTLLNETLINFNVRAHVVNVTQGPAVTRFEVFPEPGVKVSKVTNLMDDLKLSLAAQDMRMEAPIPGKHTIGIEIPNRKSKPVFLREVLDSEEFQNHPSPLAVAMGLDISGQPIVTDLRKMPHGLIAGQTGSGKSVCINTMLVSLLYKATPQEVKLMLIDPKMVELAPYNRIPHLVSPVITDVKAATAALKWAVEEMERRYELFVHAGVRDITKFNENAEQAGQFSNKLPYILIIIDELADLMMMSPADVEDAICRIAQKARACGIHLILATQRPSVDVITGLIKANIPTRVAFSVSSQVDSRTIIDSAGAEKLLGRGDMLFAENGSSKTVRLQGTFVSDEEIDHVVQHVKNEQQPNYLFEQEELLNRAQVSEETDELFFEACEFVVNQHSASTSSIQRRFRVGYNRAARLIDMMEQQGIISESRGSKPREVLITVDDLEYLHETNTAL